MRRSAMWKHILLSGRSGLWPGNTNGPPSNMAFASSRIATLRSDSGTRCSLLAFMRLAGSVHVLASRSIHFPSSSASPVRLARGFAQYERWRSVTSGQLTKHRLVRSGPGRAEMLVCQSASSLRLDHFPIKTAADLVPPIRTEQICICSKTLQRVCKALYKACCGTRWCGTSFSKPCRFRSSVR
jgi:hypothetical protein